MKFSPVFNSPLDFESGWDNWYASAGVWEVGTPTAGPGSAHSGVNCTGTRLNGNYYAYQDSRLISPTLQLPVIDVDEEIQLRFFHLLDQLLLDLLKVVCIDFGNPRQYLEFL